LADFGGASLELADRTRSPAAASRGRDALEKSLTLDPENLDAREGLYQFYMQAPWPLGSGRKAEAHLAEIRKRDSDRALAIVATVKVNEKDFSGAFATCEDALAKNPNRYVALFQFGRTAALSGERLERGLELLQKCLTLEPPGSTAPGRGAVWICIGDIHR